MQKDKSSEKRLGFQTLKEMINTFSIMQPSQPDFKTRLRFNPSKFSTSILKRYLIDLLNETNPEELLSQNAPLEYSKNPDNRTNFRVLKDLGQMSLNSWKEMLLKNNGNVECLYLHDEIMLQDSKEQYESWKIIQDEVGGFEKQMSFFRLVSEIVADLSSRNVVELSIDGKTIVCNNNEWEQMVHEEKDKNISTRLLNNNMQDVVQMQEVPVIPINSMNPMNPIMISEKLEDKTNEEIAEKLQHPFAIPKSSIEGDEYENDIELF